MPRSRLRRRESRRASEACLKALMIKVMHAGSIAKGGAELIAAGDYEGAFHAALQLEPLLREADDVLQSTSVFRIIARDTS